MVFPWNLENYHKKTNYWLQSVRIVCGQLGVDISMSAFVTARTSRL